MIITGEEIHGYKSFNANGTNCAGEIMVPGKYHYNGEVKYHKSGYHFAVNLEDTFRYSDSDQPIIAEVIGSGIIDKSVSMEDDYYGYDGLYAASDLEIIRYLTREEIIEYGLKLYSYRMSRFLYGYLLTQEELERFVKKSYTAANIIENSSFNERYNKSKKLMKD